MKNVIIIGSGIGGLMAVYQVPFVQLTSVPKR